MEFGTLHLPLVEEQINWVHVYAVFYILLFESCDKAVCLYTNCGNKCYWIAHILSRRPIKIDVTKPVW